VPQYIGSAACAYRKSSPYLAVGVNLHVMAHVVIQPRRQFPIERTLEAVPRQIPAERSIPLRDKPLDRKLSATVILLANSVSAA